MTQGSAYGIQKTLSCSYEEAVPRVREALTRGGFGVLTEIDVRATLKKKLDVEFDKYIILGACNPVVAHKTLLSEKEAGLLLPCNVIVYENPQGQSVVSAIDPVKMLEIIGNPDLTPNAEKVREMLEQVLAEL